MHAQGLFKNFILTLFLVLGLTLAIGPLRAISRGPDSAKGRATEQTATLLAEAEDAEDKLSVGSLKNLDFLAHIQVGLLPLDWSLPTARRFESSISPIPLTPAEHIFVFFLNLPPPSSC